MHTLSTQSRVSFLMTDSILQATSPPGWPRSVEPSRRGLAALLLLAVVWTAALASPARAAAQGAEAGTPGGLETELGRNEVRVLSAPFRIEPGVTLAAAALPERLERLGYRRVHDRPSAPGEYFWGHDLFWIFRRAHRVGAQRFPARLFGVAPWIAKGAASSASSTRPARRSGRTAAVSRGSSRR